MTLDPNVVCAIIQSKELNHDFKSSLQVRGLTNMCSAPLDLFSMLELGGQTQPSNAMVAMNQLTAAGHGGQYLAAVNRWVEDLGLS